MTSSLKQIEKIHEMWAKGERNKASIMREVGVSRKTLLKYLNQHLEQQNISSGHIEMSPEQKSIPTPQQPPVQAIQASERPTNEIHQPREWTWEELDEMTRPDPLTEPVYDYRFENLPPPPWEQEQQPRYYQYPDEGLQQDLQDNWIKDELTWIREELNKWKEENRRKSEEISNRKAKISQINNELLDSQNLHLQQQDAESDLDNVTPVIEEDKPVQSPVNSTNSVHKETNNQNISTSFTPATKINLMKSDEKHNTAEVNTKEPIPPTIIRENKKWGEIVKKKKIKDDCKSDITASKNDTYNLHNKQNAEITSAIPMKKNAPMEKKEEAEQDSWEIPAESLFTIFVDIGTGIIRSCWENKPIELQPVEQRNNKNLTNYQGISNRKTTVLQPVKKEDNKILDQQENP